MTRWNVDDGLGAFPLSRHAVSAPSSRTRSWNEANDANDAVMQN
jgi:hypothetical protein